MVTRSNVMEPTTTENLDRFLALMERVLRCLVWVETCSRR
jgi:hypothetical protein